MITKDDISKDLDKINLRWVKWGVIINFVMLLIVIIQLFNVHIPVPSFDKKEHLIYNVEPEIYPTDLYLLTTNPIYYVEMQVNTGGIIKYGDDLKFSISTNNKGKKNIESPEYKILICDPLGRIRGVYPKINAPINTSEDLLTTEDDISAEESSNKLNFVFKLPTEDQKVIGDWKILVYLFDKNSNSLISYNIQEFKVTESGSNFETFFTYITILVGMSTVLISIVETWQKRKKLKKLEQIFKENDY
jgi:hypothetical protein